MSRIGLIFLGIALLAATDAAARVLPTTARAWSLVDRGDAPVASTLSLTDLDDGGGAPRMGVNYNRDRFVAIFLSILPGFGLGHFWANDEAGFIVFLIVDVVIWGSWFAGPWLLPRFGFLFSLLVLAAKIWQVFDCVRVTRGKGGGGDVVFEAPVLVARPVERDLSDRAGPLQVPLAAISF